VCSASAGACSAALVCSGNAAGACSLGLVCSGGGATLCSGAVTACSAAAICSAQVGNGASACSASLYACSAQVGSGISACSANVAGACSGQVGIGASVCSAQVVGVCSAQAGPGASACSANGAGACSAQYGPGPYACSLQGAGACSFQGGPWGPSACSAQGAGACSANSGGSCSAQGAGPCSGDPSCHKHGRYRSQEEPTDVMMAAAGLRRPPAVSGFQLERSDAGELEMHFSGQGFRRYELLMQDSATTRWHSVHQDAVLDGRVTQWKDRPSPAPRTRRYKLRMEDVSGQFQELGPFALTEHEGIEKKLAAKGPRASGLFGWATAAP